MITKENKESIARAHDFVFTRCVYYFEACKQNKTKFAQRHLDRLKNTLKDIKWRELDVPNNLLEALSWISEFTYMFDVRFSEDKTSLIRVNPFYNAIFSKNPLLARIPKYADFAPTPITIPMVFKEPHETK